MGCGCGKSGPSGVPAGKPDAACRWRWTTSGMTLCGNPGKFAGRTPVEVCPKFCTDCQAGRHRDPLELPPGNPIDVRLFRDCLAAWPAEEPQRGLLENTRMVLDAKAVRGEGPCGDCQRMMRLWRKLAAARRYIPWRLLLVGNAPIANYADPSQFDEVVVMNEVRHPRYLPVADTLWMRRDRPDGSHFGGESVVDTCKARPILCDGLGKHEQELLLRLKSRDPEKVLCISYCPDYPRTPGKSPSTGFSASMRYTRLWYRVYVTGFTWQGSPAHDWEYERQEMHRLAFSSRIHLLD